MPERRTYHEQVEPPVEDPLAAVVALADAHRDRTYVCYEYPDGWAFASGAVAELLVYRERVLLRLADGSEISRGWGEDPLRQLPQLLSLMPVQAWRAYGWCGYELAVARAGRPDLVGDEPLLHLIVPRSEIRFQPGGTVVRSLDGIIPGWPVKPQPRESDGLQAAPPLDIETGRAQYEAVVRRAIQEIQRGRLQKVIASRVVPVPFPVDLAATYEVGRRANNPARSFVFSLGGLSAAGFSPETVVEVTADGDVITQPLAGTRARTGDAQRDSALRQELVTDGKEIFEHAISVRVAYEELATVCHRSSLAVTEFMDVRPRGTVQHLASAVRGQLTDEHGAWDAFGALFPAVTASGVPKLPAYEVIAELEETARGPYSGAVLMYDHTGALDAGLVLRTVFQQQGRSWLRAGAGIVGPSRPAREFTETCEKLASVARYLVPRTITR
jgi:salicylate synthase